MRSNGLSSQDDSHEMSTFFCFSCDLGISTYHDRASDHVTVVLMFASEAELCMIMVNVLKF